MRHPTLFQNMRQLRQAIAANIRELHTLRKAIRIRRSAADHEASLARQLEEAAEMLEAAELNLRVRAARVSGPAACAHVAPVRKASSSEEARRLTAPVLEARPHPPGFFFGPSACEARHSSRLLQSSQDAICTADWHIFSLWGEKTLRRGTTSSEGVSMSATRSLIFSMLALAAMPLAHAQVSISGVISGQVAPGVYGQVTIGGGPPPPVVYAQPVVAMPPPVIVGAPPVEPIYLRVPPGHEKHWDKHCHEYNACNRPVYFVRSAENEDHHKHHNKHDD